MKDLSDKRFLVLSSLFFLLFFLSVATVTLQKPLSRILRAKNVTPSAAKSFAIVFPQVGVAGDKNGAVKPTDIKVTITIRDANGAVLPNRQIKISSSLGSVAINPSDTQLTDDLGQVQFLLTSSVSGKVQLTAIDIESNINITNIPSIEFTQ